MGRRDDRIVGVIAGAASDLGMIEGIVGGLVIGLVVGFAVHLLGAAGDRLRRQQVVASSHPQEGHLELTPGLSASVMDMHIHTNPASSDSMLDPAELMDLAPGIGITGVNLTEHDKVMEPHQIKAFREAHTGTFANFGMEVSTDMGHMLAVGLPAYIGGIRRAEKLREELDKLGGFLIVAHPFRRLFDPVTAMRTGEKFELTPEQAAEQMPIFKLVHAIEVGNGANTPQENYFALEVAQILGIPTTGGSDAHSTSGIATFATGFERTFDTPEGFLEELHAGRFEAVHKGTDGSWVRLEAGSIEVARGESA